MFRKIPKDFTFSNGTFIPAGNTISVAAYPMHLDEVRPFNYDGLPDFDLWLQEPPREREAIWRLQVFKDPRSRRRIKQTSDGFAWFGLHRIWRRTTCMVKFFILFASYIQELTHKLPSPGRFFAANLLKAMLVHVLLTYDVTLENEGVRPENRWSGFMVTPDPTAVVMFRKRSA
jgi:hypothetical protein